MRYEVPYTNSYEIREIKILEKLIAFNLKKQDVFSDRVVHSFENAIKCTFLKPYNA